MKKGKTVRFNKIVHVYNHPPTLLVDREENDMTLPAKYTESSYVTRPAMHREDSNVTEPAMHTEDGDGTGPAVHTEDGDGTGPAVHTEDGDGTGPAVHTEGQDVTELALAIVRSAINAAIKTVEENEYTIKNINWLTHGEFTPERGRKQIEEYILTWECHDHWVYYTKLIETRDVVHSLHYIYSVRWSIPTAQIPLIPESTYAFFTIKFNKNKPPDAPIEVSYIFEGQSLLHRPGKDHYPETCVKYMLQAKHMLMTSLPF